MTEAVISLWATNEEVNFDQTYIGMCVAGGGGWFGYGTIVGGCDVERLISLSVVG